MNSRRMKEEQESFDGGHATNSMRGEREGLEGNDGHKDKGGKG